MTLGLGLTLSPPCDRSRMKDPCETPEDAAVECEACGARYQRCARHGGAAGAQRSLTSHKGVCPKKRPAAAWRFTTNGGTT